MSNYFIFVPRDESIVASTIYVIVIMDIFTGIIVLYVLEVRCQERSCGVAI